MADKLLLESTWKSFAKGKTLDDDALMKSLAKLGKIKEDKHDEVLSALDDLEGVLNKAVVANAKRKEKDVKEVKDQLQDMLAALEKTRKQTRKDKDEQESAESEDEESPALLTTKMVPLIRLLRKGDEKLNAAVGVQGTEAAVLISRKFIGPSQKKVLANDLGGSGVKYAVGTCFFEAGALVFQVDKSPGQLAKKIREALIKQTDFKLRIKIRTDDGESEDDGEEEGEGPEAEGEQDAKPEAKAEAKGAPQAPVADKDKMAFAQLLLKLRPVLEEAVGAKLPQAAALQALMAEATAKVKAGDSAAGLADLKKLELQLAEAKRAAADAQATADNGGVDPKVGFTARLNALLPRIQEATKGDHPRGPDIKLKFGQMGVLAKKPDYPGAHTVLDEIEDMLAQKPTAAPTGGTSQTTNAPTAGGGSPEEKLAEVETLHASLLDDFEALQRGPLSPALRQQFQPLMNGWMVAQDAIGADQYDRALLVLRKMKESGTLAKLRKAMDEAHANGPGEDNGKLVRQRAFLVERWTKVPPQLRGMLAPLRKELAASGADDDPDGLVDAIADELDTLLEDLQDEIDKAINKGSTAGLAGVRASFQGHALVDHLMSAPGLDAAKLLKAVLDAVDEIESEMTR